MTMSIIRWDPFSVADQFSKDIFGGMLPQTAMNAPTTDIYVQDDKELVVEAQMVGFNEKDIDINVSDGNLEIRAEKKQQQSESKHGSKRYVLRETAQSFYRSIRLPRYADESKIDAKLENGCLSIRVPFKQLPKPKSIAIKTAGK